MAKAAVTTEGAELGRQERNITPVDLAAYEIYDILRKRLFKSLPDKAEIEDIAEAFGRKLEEAAKSKTTSRGAEAILCRGRPGHRIQCPAQRPGADHVSPARELPGHGPVRAVRNWRAGDVVQQAGPA